ncbi:MAG: hypothetical protein EXS05_12135 [Planctomycetaceae bacterium]|nr:hypothetical protein [Planctomycetaceae bacterium]
MTDRHKFLPETETTVPILRAPGEGRVVGVLGDNTTFKVLSAQTGGPTGDFLEWYFELLL